jgi:DNA-binding transcriptional MerR regulator
MTAPDDAHVDPADAALAEALASPPDDTIAELDAGALAEAAGVSQALLDAVIASGILPPHHVDDTGVARYSQADVSAVRAGRSLLDAGLPLAELLALAESAGGAIGEIAEAAVDAFIAYVRDPLLADDEDAAAARLVHAYEAMLPATERIVAHHLRRRLVSSALARLAGAPPS